MSITNHWYTIKALSAKQDIFHKVYTIPLECLNMRTMLRVLAFQTRTIPSSDPDINKFSLEPYAKQVTWLLLQWGTKLVKWHCTAWTNLFCN